MTDPAGPQYPPPGYPGNQGPPPGYPGDQGPYGHPGYQGPPPDYRQQSPFNYAAATGVSRSGVIALVCGCLSFLVIPAVPAVIFGVKGIREGRKTGRGVGLSIGGLLCGVIEAVLVLIIVVVVATR